MKCGAVLICGNVGPDFVVLMRILGGTLSRCVVHGEVGLVYMEAGGMVYTGR